MTEQPDEDKTSFEAKKAEALQHFHAVRAELNSPGLPSASPARPHAPHSGTAVGQWIFGFSCIFACFIAREAVIIQALLMAVAGLFLYKSVRAIAVDTRLSDSE